MAVFPVEVKHTQKRKTAKVNLLVSYEVMRCNLLLLFWSYHSSCSPISPCLGSLTFPATVLWLGHIWLPLKLPHANPGAALELDGKVLVLCFFFVSLFLSFFPFFPSSNQKLIWAFKKGSSICLTVKFGIWENVKATVFCLMLSNFSDTLWAFITQSYTLTMKQAPKCFFSGLTNTIYVGMVLKDCTVGLVLFAFNQTKKSTAKHHLRSGIMLKWITVQYFHQVQFKREEKQRKLCI